MKLPVGVIGKAEMTLQEFIDEMKKGWGFARPGRVMQIGYALDKIIPAEDRNRIVKVNFESDTSGWGPNFHYHYRWYVKGYKPPVEGNIHTTSDVIFGSVKKFIHPIEDGFVCGYDW